MLEIYIYTRNIYIRTVLCLYTRNIYIMVYIFIGEGDGTPLQYSCLENPMDGDIYIYIYIY